MKIIMSACFGFALTVSAFALGGAPASAFQAGAIAVTAPNGAIKVQDRDRRDYIEDREREERRERRQREARERSERCEHVRRECREDRGREFRQCVERRGC